MGTNEMTERWLAGPVNGIPTLLQPVAHALLQATREVTRVMEQFPSELLWQPVAEMASPGFHLQHIAGVLDRLFTYARGEMLNDEQMQYLKTEGTPFGQRPVLPEPAVDLPFSEDVFPMLRENNQEVTLLINHLRQRVNLCLEQLFRTDPATLTDARGVGRKQVPSTIIGLLTHAAEHTMRHTGQLLVTAGVLTSAHTHNR